LVFKGFQASAQPLAVKRPDGSIKNFKKANIEYRIMNVECRRNVFCQFYKKKSSEAKPPFEIRYSIFCGSAVRFLKVAFSNQTGRLKIRTPAASGPPVAEHLKPK
jgi:hypothetical protein